MTLLEEFADCVIGTRWSHIGASARSALSATLVDTIGCIGAAANEDFAERTVEVAGTTCGQGRCSVAGRQVRLAPAGAAMVNGTLGHGFDFDDAHLPSIAHFSTIVIPAAMAACELAGATGTAFLEAVLVGDEVGGRLGSYACSSQEGGSAIRGRGFFPTSVLGTVAAAAAAAKALHLGHAQTAESIAIACSFAGGLASISRGDNSTKRSQAGWAAQAGLSAALLARGGFTGPASVLEGEQGFLGAFMGPKIAAPRSHDTDARWICEDMSFKLYPIEYVLHPLVELAGRARACSIDLAQVTAIEAAAPSRFASLFEPTAAKISPSNSYSAALSGPYCIARALTKAHDAVLRLEDFRSGYVMDDGLRRLAAKVRFTPKSSIDARFPQHLGGSLRFLSADRVLWEGAIADVYGSPDRPMSKSDLLRKFHDNMAVLPADAEQIVELIDDLEREQDASWIARVLSATHRAS